jgi:hypothetical protein
MYPAGSIKFSKTFRKISQEKSQKCIFRHTIFQEEYIHLIEIFKKYYDCDTCSLVQF